MSFTPVKINPANSSVDLQRLVVPHPFTGRNHAKLNSVEVNILFGKKTPVRFPIRDSKNYERLRGLSAEEAIVCFLEGDFTIGEESALAEAVQRGLSLPLKKEEVEAVLSDCMADEVSAEECRGRLIAAVDGAR